MSNSDNDNGKNNRYRRLVEHEQKMMDDMSERLGHLEMSSASTRSDIKSLFNLVESIAAQLDRIVDRTRPNTLGMFAAAFTMCGLLATIGVLAFSPVYRSLDQIHERDAHMQKLMEGVISTRFTPEDGRRLEFDFQKQLRELDNRTNNRVTRNEEWIMSLMQEASQLRGSHDRGLNDD